SAQLALLWNTSEQRCRTLIRALGDCPSVRQNLLCPARRGAVVSITRPPRKGRSPSTKEVVPMIAITKPERQDAPRHENEQFLKFVPDIERYARWLLRDLRAEEREEAVCEVLAFAFCAFRCLARHGKRDLAYATPLARFGVARFRCGRRSYSKRIGRDVFSHVVQRRRGFSLQSLHSADSRGNIWLEILADD